MSDEGNLNLSFNQNGSCLAVGTNYDVTLISLSLPKNPARVYNRAVKDGIRIVERLFASSLVAIVSFQNLRKLRVFHIVKATEICNFAFKESINAVRLNRARIVVCLENSLCIHSIQTMKPIHVIKHATQNSKGILALSPNEINSLLAFPGSSITGHVEIFDTISLSTKLRIQAHVLPVAALVFNASGTLLATSSTRGTVIRIFNTLNGSRIIEFQRGFIPVDIYSIAFSPFSKFLVVSSSSDTVDVFRIETLIQQQEEEEATTSTDTGNSDNSWSSWIGWAKESLVPVLPTTWSEYLVRQNAIFNIVLPTNGKRSIVAVSHEVTTETDSGQNELIIHVGSQDGFLYTYELKQEKEIKSAIGEFLLVSQFRFD